MSNPSPSAFTVALLRRKQGAPPTDIRAMYEAPGPNPDSAAADAVVSGVQPSAMAVALERRDKGLEPQAMYLGPEFRARAETQPDALALAKRLDGERAVNDMDSAQAWRQRAAEAEQGDRARVLADLEAGRDKAQPRGFRGLSPEDAAALEAQNATFQQGLTMRGTTAPRASAASAMVAALRKGR